MCRAASSVPQTRHQCHGGGSKRWLRSAPTELLRGVQVLGRQALHTLRLWTRTEEYVLEMPRKHAQLNHRLVKMLKFKSKGSCEDIRALFARTACLGTALPNNPVASAASNAPTLRPCQASARFLGCASYKLGLMERRHANITPQDLRRFKNLY